MRIAETLRIACLIVIASSALTAIADDQDGDGVENSFDVCCNTPPGIPVDPQGRPLGDIDNDCDVDLNDFALLQASFTGPLPEPQCCYDNSECGLTEYCNKELGDCLSYGTCTAKPLACPDVWDPVCGCDNITYGNACEAAFAGVNVDYTGECLPPPCSSNGECTTEEYCAKANADCDGTGTCTAKPLVCPNLWDPVCGCDNITYTNTCYAAYAGVNVDYTGQCVPPPCSSNGECAAEDYCAKTIGDCDGTGTCTTKPLACPDVWDPVCGCDNVTYANDCEAAYAGINVDYAGECVPPPCNSNGQCAEDEYCAKDNGDCEGAGTCAAKPLVCPNLWDPVCGCDNVTYTNTCYAALAGESIDYSGTCTQPQ